MLEIDEDQTRICARCKERPRWSKHPHCRLCATCAGPTEVARKIRIRSQWITKRAAWSKPRNVATRERYARLRAAGVHYQAAKRAAETKAATERVIAHLRRLDGKTT